jgi:gliding motility-associated-like protein
MKNNIYTLILSLFAFSTLLQSQIISTGHTASTPTLYATSADKDSIYLYADLSSGSLAATPPIGATTVKYDWYEYDKINKSWNLFESNALPTLQSVLEETGYELRVTADGNPAGTFNCWVFVPNIDSAKVDTLQSTCSNLYLNVNTYTKKRIYYDLGNGNPLELPYSLTYSWSSLPVSDINGNTVVAPVIDAPFDTTTYTVNISAFNGADNLQKDYVFDNPIAVEAADFNFNVKEDNINEVSESESYSNITSYTGSGALSVTVDSENNNSKGIILTHDWSIDREGGGNYDSSEGKIPSFTDITEVGVFNINLQVSNNHCSDTKQVGPIRLQELAIDIPNVFTPDGDGINDKFMVVYTSVADFKMTILNRWGRVVFKTKNPSDYWDGRIAGRKAAEGVYFYYIEAKGFNEGEFEKLEGPVHLLRGK